MKKLNRRGGITISKALKRNREITAKEVRLVGADDKQVGVVSIMTALKCAEDAGLDLVEVSPGRDDQPPVCKVMDYGKHSYQQNKNKDQARRHSHQMKTKEVRFTPRIGEEDFQVKLRNIINFLNHGDKVRAIVRFRFREMAYRDEHGMEILKRVEALTLEMSSIEQAAKFEGKQMIMILAPKKKS